MYARSVLNAGVQDRELSSSWGRNTKSKMKPRSLKPAQFFSLVMVGLFLLIGAFLSASQSKPETKAANKPIEIPSKHSGPLPKAEFGRNPAETAAQRIHRQSREDRHRNFFPLISDPGKLVQGQQETAGIMIIDTVTVESSEQFPVSLSAAVIVGTVMNAQGFVSQDRTYVYSDFEVRVDEILKQDGKAKLSVGKTVVVSRIGGSVYFPSGHMRKYMVMGQGMPKIGSRYVLFLWKPDPAFPEYEILDGAAFELTGGLVYPLDEEGLKFEGMDSSAFLTEIKKATGASKD
jgi:hypothetical protein